MVLFALSPGCNDYYYHVEETHDEKSSESVCDSGDSLICNCGGQPPREGIQRCVPGGGAWGPCECPDVCDKQSVSCDSCSDCAIKGACKGAFNTCAQSQACISMGKCLANECSGEHLCFFECAKKNPTGASDYIALIECVQCDACLENCLGGGLCDIDCENQCELKFPSGVFDYYMMAGCRICDACSTDCAASCSGPGSGTCSGAGDCGTCANSNCALAACSEDVAACSNNPDCMSLNDCYAKCP
jgi:hypothetical protein